MLRQHGRTQPHEPVDFVGSKFYAEQNYQPDGAQLDLPGADVCHRSSVAYQCRRGGVDFTLSGGVTKDVNFAGRKGDLLRFYLDHVLVEYTKLVLPKLPYRRSGASRQWPDLHRTRPGGDVHRCIRI